MLCRLQMAWRNWRERRRQYQIKRALYQANVGYEGLDPSASAEHDSLPDSGGGVPAVGP